MTTPQVYLLNIETGQKEIVGAFPGMTFAPRFSPDGQRIVMSLEQGGNAESVTPWICAAGARCSSPTAEAIDTVALLRA